MTIITSATAREDYLKSPQSDVEVIQVAGLSKRYGKLVAVKGIDFAVKRGEIFGLIGPDGAGKTTTFHILGGVMEASAGKIEILGKRPRDARLSIGYLTQQFSLYLDLSIDENLRYSAGLREVPDQVFRQRRDKYLRLMSIEQFSDRIAGRLSGGMKQKLALCCALISQPEILLLDEPTTGVDPVSRREFWDILAAVAGQGVTIVVATPYLDEAERCDRLALIYDGQIQQIGTLGQLRKSLGLQRLEVRTDQIVAAEQILHNAIANKQTTIVDVQTFGDRLDVLVKDAAVGIAAVEKIFSQQQLQLQSIYTAEATLENVFVTRLRASGNDPAFLPFPRSRQQTHPLTTFSDSGGIGGDVAIGAKNLKKVFGDFQAVKSVNLEICHGEIYGLLGANGAGKTTTIKMLCGLLEATSGKISLAGQTQNLRSSALRQRLGYMSQKFTLYDDLSIIQNLEFYCGVYSVPPRLRRKKIDWVLATCGLVGKENMLTGQLPGGWKQRVAFGASVMHEPEILFLDEPTSGVDPLARRQFWRLINEFARSGTAVLVTTHYLEEAEQCHRMGFMVAGEVVIQGSPSEIKASLPGQLVEVATDKTQIASNLLKTQFTPWRVSIFGDRLHLVLDHPDSDLPRIRSILQAEGINLHSLRPIPFSLEDAFIGIVQRTQKVTKPA
ncbi:ABC-type multidrug transport system, ATPase component [Cylindrospermum stagnale PCC 7417]|uniref:ABC-type multidrug transport system, ATPase component n=1 Tax=Cylindrospermum stagnale PCC 7417 TaxID=56107 RepID=K9WXW9_9NOST|nr:ATP-binding cassette domain-containing protein [Cylindrospermum stagnale]AFZ24659.1 ABC-type multidrug transport system, ATPase component [Cylindrospermum stagnale PCC 7417]